MSIIRKALATYDGLGSGLLNRLSEEERHELADYIESELNEGVTQFGAMMAAAKDTEIATLEDVANRAGIIWTCDAKVEAGRCLWNNPGDHRTCLQCGAPKPVSAGA